MRKFASLGSRGVASITDQAAAAAINLAVGIFIGRHLGADALGLFAITNVFVLTVRSMQNSMVLEPMAVFGPRLSPAAYPGYFGFLVGLEALSILAFTALLALGSAVAYALDLIARDLLFAMLASCLFMNFLCFQSFLARQFYVEHRQYLASIQSISFFLLVSAGLAVLWRIDGLSVFDIYMLLTVCSIVVCVVQGWRLRTSVAKPLGAATRRYARDHWSFGKWILLAVPFGILTYQGFFVIVGSAISSEAAGLLKAADIFIAPFAQIVTGLQLMLIPMASRNVDTMTVSAQKIVAFRIAASLVAVSLVYAALIYVVGGWALVLLFGDQMQDAVLLLKILAITPVFRALPMAASVILTSRKQANLRFVSRVTSTIMALCIAVPLIYFGGLTGAAIAMVLSEAIFAATNWACVLWLWRTDGRRAAAAVA